MDYFFAALSAFIVALLMANYNIKPESIFYVLDHPNDRSLHSEPIPRTGGVAIMLGTLSGIVLLVLAGNVSQPVIYIFSGTFLMSVLSFIDDHNKLSVRLRLLGHVACAMILIIGGITFNKISVPGFDWVLNEWITIFLSVLFIVWMVNLYNFMDGMDGFAGGMSLIGFSVLAIMGAMAGEFQFMGVSLLIAASSAGFLVYNYPPAKIFMGDSGATGIGLSAAGLSIWGSNMGIFPFWVPVLIFSPFIVDATVTLLKRIVCGQKIWIAHKTHYYQRYVQAGWGHGKTVIMEYILMISCGMSSIISTWLTYNQQWSLIILWVMVYLFLFRYVYRLERSRIYTHDNHR